MNSEQNEIVFDKPYLTIHWNPSDRIVMMEWKDFVYGEEFRQALDKGLSIVIENKTNRWLADLRHLGVLSPGDQKWSNENWFPRAHNAGLTRMALVLPERAVAKMGVNNIMKKVADDTLVTNYFKSVDDAYNWLANS